MKDGARFFKLGWYDYRPTLGSFCEYNVNLWHRGLAMFEVIWQEELIMTPLPHTFERDGCFFVEQFTLQPEATKSLREGIV